jgi:His/Glu/Gln/Arg/opine family amino acid ABC transporter permease subunit
LRVGHVSGRGLPRPSRIGGAVLWSQVWRKVVSEARSMVQAPKSSANAQATLRFLAVALALVLIFGACASYFLAVFDKQQTHSSGSLFDPGVLFGNVLHFIQQTIKVITTGVTPTGIPYHTLYVTGLLTTIEFCFISLPLALLFGLILALMSRSRLLALRAPARAYVEFFRNTPLLVQMLAIYFGLSSLPSWFVNPFTAAVATLVLNYAAYECENIRGGLAALDKGQGEAAASLGLGYFQSLRHVLIPQTISIVLPPVLNDLIYMFKDSSILSLISIIELTSSTQRLVRQVPSLTWEFYLVGAGLYLLLSLPLSRVARSVETRLKSVSFAPKGDLTVMSLEVLLGGVALGLLCGVIVRGISGATVGSLVGQYLVSILLVLAIMCSTMVVLGGIIYLPALLLRFLRRRNLPSGASGGAQSAVAVAN